MPANVLEAGGMLVCVVKTDGRKKEGRKEYPRELLLLGPPLSPFSFYHPPEDNPEVQGSAGSS